jgi:hypothetical protein
MKERFSCRIVTMARMALVAVAMTTAPASPARADVSITPRAACYFDNISQRQSAIDLNTPASLATLTQIETLVRALGGQFVALRANTARNSNQLAFPQFGLTVNLDWRGSEATQVALTALYGRATGDDTTVNQQFFGYTLAGASVQDTLATTQVRHGRFTRLDLESTVQHRLNETFTLIGGIRAERTNSSFERLSLGGLSGNFFNLVASLSGLPPFIVPPQQFTFASDSLSAWSYSARFGAAAYAQSGEKHLFYVNGLLQLNRTPSVNYTTSVVGGTGPFKVRQNGETAAGPDISVGYMYRVSDRFGIDLRYRATVYFTLAGDSRFSDSRVNHGFGIGFTSWIGRR